METNKKYFMDCHLAGRKYHDADEVWEQQRVGTPLRLVREADNRHDAHPEQQVQLVIKVKRNKESV